MVNPRLHIIFVYTCMQLGVYSSCIMDIISSRHCDYGMHEWPVERDNIDENSGEAQRRFESSVGIYHCICSLYHCRNEWAV